MRLTSSSCHYHTRRAGRSQERGTGNERSDPASNGATGQTGRHTANSPRVIQACRVNSREKRAPKVIWEPPNDAEWRRAVRVVAKQVTMHIAGYLNQDEFEQDGCLFS